MLRIFWICCLLWIASGVSGQEKTIRKSDNVVVIKGQSYYLHTVESGQTLYSICKAYGADLEKVKELNGKKDNTLSLYEVIRVPYVEPYVQQDKDYYYHKIGKGETLYSLSRRFGIAPRRIMKANEEYSHGESLPIGAVVRLPLKEIDRSQIGKVSSETVAAVKEEQKPVSRPSGEKTVAGTNPDPVVKPVQPVKPVAVDQSRNISENLPARKEIAGNPVVKEDSKADVADGQVKDVNHKEMPSYISEVLFPSDPFVKIALLLPFYSEGYPMLSDSVNLVGLSATIASRSEQFLSFYEGILLAVDSLKNRGYQIELHVYDTEREPQKMIRVADELNKMKPDLIIGPVYGSVFKALADRLDNKNIPMVYPLSSRSENFGQYSNFIQVNASLPILADKMAGWISGQSAHANVICVNLGDDSDVAEMTEKKVFAHRMKQMNGVTFFKWNFSHEPLDALKRLLSEDKENIIVLPSTKEAEVSKLLTSLSAFVDKYKITVVGFPEWQTFTSVDHETYYKLNTKIFTYSYVDNNSAAAQAFSSRFRNYFRMEPNSLAFKAYDIGLYFIEMAAKYRDRTLEALEYAPKDSVFSRFSFSRMADGQGKENHGFYIVNFGSDYQLKITDL